MTRDCEHGRQIGKCADCEVIRLEALNAELLESFDEILAVKFSNWSDGEMREIARAAIAKATGEQK